MPPCFGLSWVVEKTPGLLLHHFAWFVRHEFPPPSFRLHSRAGRVLDRQPHLPVDGEAAFVPPFAPQDIPTRGSYFILTYLYRRLFMEESSIRTARLLVVTTDSSLLDSVCLIAKANRWRFEIAADAWEAMDKVHSEMELDLLLLDMPKDPKDGLPILLALRRIRPALPLVLIGHVGDFDRKREAVRMGARDYLLRPLPDRQLEAALRLSLVETEEMIETDITSEDVEPVGNGNFFIGVSPAMRNVRTRVTKLAEIDVPVFILGESGSGRETAARLLHRQSVRSGFEFARVNCSALPEELLEREIFGDTSGGTNAVFRAKRGKLELCDHGTIFLDEITEMPLRLQERLAQVLRDRRFTRSGTAEPVEVDIRVVAASSVSIREAVAGCRLLTDLSRQFVDHQLQVPALRERKDELPFLSRHFMHQLARRYGLPPREIAQAVSEAWQAHEWPGNLRELEQSVKRYLILGDELLGLQWSPVNGKDATQDRASARQSQTNGRRPIVRSGCGMNACKPLRDLLQSVKAEAERAAIGLALERTGWNRKAAARLLKTSYRTVLYKIEQYQMSPSGSSSLQVTNGLESEKAGLRGDSHRNAPAPDAPDLPAVDSGRQFTL